MNSRGQATGGRWGEPANSKHRRTGLAGGMYVIGHLRHDDRLRETGLLGAAAFLPASIVTSALKAATNGHLAKAESGDSSFYFAPTFGYAPRRSTY